MVISNKYLIKRKDKDVLNKNTSDKKMKENNFISLVLYFYNIDEEKVMSLPQKISAGLISNFKNYEIIIVNDGENTKKVDKFVKELNKYTAHNTISIINFSSYVGIEKAMIAGDDLAIGDYIFEFDMLNADFSQNMLMEAYRTALKGNDIVSVLPIKAHNSLSASLFYTLYNRGVNEDQHIDSELYRVVSRRAFNRTKAMARSIAYRKACYAACGLKKCTLVDKTAEGYKVFDSKQKFYRINLGIDSLMIFTNIIQKFSFFISLLFLILTVAISVYVVGVFTLSRPVAGWTPIMAYLSLGFFGVFALLTIVLKYLSVILNMIFKSENHLIESIKKI